jgi:hypothetical protein
VSRKNQNFSLYRGESKIVFIALSNADGTEFDPTGCAMRWWMAKSPYSIINNDDEVLVEKTLEDGGLVLATGGVNVRLIASDTFVVPNIYYHELKVFLPGGGVAMTCTGYIMVRSSSDMRSRPELDAGAAAVVGAGTVT